MSGEFARIERLAALFGGAPPEGLLLGIGDDAAVLLPPAGACLVWTVDTQVEQVHFRRGWMSLADVGWRSFVAAASDLSAMGATPWAALSAVNCPLAFTDAELDELAAGQSEAARAVRCPIVGGNLARSPALSVTTTLLGSCHRPVPRGGAQAGDSVWIAGALGLAAAGLHALLEEVPRNAEVDAAIHAFRRPSPLLEAGAALGHAASAAIDVSDGLAQDVAHVAAASHVAIVLDEAMLREHARDTLERTAAAVGKDALDLLLHGGEDYALIATSVTPIPGFTRVGEVRAGSGVILRTGQIERAIEPRGFDHFKVG